ncbi:MAG: hypothetical protein AB3K77_07605, partial [Methanosarcinaceae archaeon]
MMQDEAYIGESPIQESKIRKSTIQESTIQESTIQESTIQESTIQESTIQESTIQESTIQESTIRKNIILESTRQWNDFLSLNLDPGIRKYGRNLKRFNRGGLLLFTFFLILALFPALFAPYSPTERFIPYEAPSTAHLLGTNDIGNDILSELAYGARISMMVGFASACISTLIGLMIGLFSGYFRGTPDELLMGFTDVVLII